METIITGLEPALQKLSEMFCISVDAIKQNGMEYILMYGKYYYIHDMPFMLIMLIVISGIISFVTWGLIDETSSIIVKNKYVIITFISILVLLFILSSLSYWMCPEMYSINAVMQLIQ